MSDINSYPFTEIVERTNDLSRSGTNDEKRTRGITNDLYTKEIPRTFDYSFLKATSAISCIAEYNSGTVSVGTQNTVCTFVNGGTLDGSFTGRKIKFSGNDNVYDFTYSDSTGGNISPALAGAIDVTTGSFLMYKNIYSMPSDFDRFPMNGGLLFYQAGQPRPLPEKEDDDYYERTVSSTSSTPDFCRPMGHDTAGNIRYEIIPPPASPYVLQNEYLKALKPMYEETAGTIVFELTGMVVTGTTTFFTNANTGDYLRIDQFGIAADSKWHRITAITSESDMTVTPAIKGNSGGSYTDYTISSVPLYPFSMQDALIYGGVRNLIVDQNDPNFMFYNNKYAQVLSDNKLIYHQRKMKDDVELIAEDYEYRR